jgi:hypothetical protein
MTHRSLARGVAAGALLLFAASVTTACRDAAEPVAAEPPTEPTTAHVEQAAAAAKALGGRLKARLVETMQAEGPVAAIEVCNVEAPAIAADVGTAAGLDVGRTSLKVRNPANRPGPRERAVLEQWVEAVAAGTPVSELPAHVGGEGEEFLWMKPIGIEAPCLACHGETLAEPVAKAIAARYPSDQATGYALGELRGAFVVRATDTSTQ